MHPVAYHKERACTEINLERLNFMTFLIQFTDMDSMITYANKRFDSKLLNSSCNAQSDRAAEFVAKFIEKLESFDMIYRMKLKHNMKSNDSLERIDDLIKVLALLDKIKVTDSTRAVLVAKRNTHKQYMHLKEASVNAGLTMIEWMFAVTYYVLFYEMKREAYQNYQHMKNDQHKLETEVYRETRRLEKSREKIASIQKGIDIQLGHMQTHKNAEEEALDRLEELAKLLDEKSKQTGIEIQEKTKSQLAAENRFGEALKEVDFF